MPLGLHRTVLPAAARSPYCPEDAAAGVLRLSFPDAETPSERFSEHELFSREQAARIWSFVDEHRLHIERTVVHCDAGVSRSVAVGAVLARVLNGDDAEFFGGRCRPSMRVYKTLLELAPTH